MVFSLLDGLLVYQLDFMKVSPISKRSFEEMVDSENIDSVMWYYPYHTVSGNKYQCMPEFVGINSRDK